MKFKNLFPVLILVSLVPLSVSAKQIWAKSFLGKKAPELIVEKWLTPEPKTAGKFVLIDFWATWCPPCREAIPELNNIYHKLGDKVCVIGISDELEEKVKALVSPKIDYVVAIDTNKRTKSAVEVRGIPHVLLIDPKGIVRWEGFPLLEGDELTLQVVQQVIEKYSAK